MNTMTEYGCDSCGAHVPDGDGLHIGDDRVCQECYPNMAHSWGDMANLTHETQVAGFGFCLCEDGPKVYDDCPERA